MANSNGDNNMAIVRGALAGITGQSIEQPSPEPRAPRNACLESDCYVLMTEPNRETTAQANLMLRQIPHYLPTIYRAARLSARQHAARVERPDVSIPLFPRTIFMSGADLVSHYHVIVTLPGMTSRPLMKFGDRYAVVRPEGMQAIHYIEAGEREIYLRKKKRPAVAYLPQIGEQVSVIVDEVLGGVRGEVSAIDDKGRITILTEIMKRTVRVKLNADQIEPV